MTAMVREWKTQNLLKALEPHIAYFEKRASWDGGHALPEAPAPEQTALVVRLYRDLQRAG